MTPDDRPTADASGAPPDHRDPDAFIARWHPSGGQESANYALFLTELCDLIGVPHPDPATEETARNAYVFERRIDFPNGDGTSARGRIDLYKRGCFVLEAKQSGKPERQRLVQRQGSRAQGTATRGTKRWDDAIRNAFGQAKSYVANLPPDEGAPPFLLVVDVGHVIEVHADFSGTGRNYSPFPDINRYRLRLDDLRDATVRERLRLIWQGPYALDPTRHSAAVTKDVAKRLAELARSLEQAGHGAEPVADFLMRCLFTLFAEDVELLPRDRVTELLRALRGSPQKFKPMIEDLWRAMNTGGFSVAIQEEVLEFDGTLFADPSALALDGDQLELLIDAAESDWRDVEPAIFGSLFEGALDKRQRHDLGAHFTPRAYVERLVLPTVIEPLREDWGDVQTAATTLAENGKPKDAVEQIRAYHRKLCRTRVLDPACGSGNFLYVTMEHMKRLEAEVLDALYELDPPQHALEMEGHAVQPEQFLGIEINPRAAAIARLVIWIGYLQWHLRTRKGKPGEPILGHAASIENRDAILDYDRVEIARDEDGRPITHWDGETYKTSPTTGDPVPDEDARREVLHYVNPRPAKWPDADYVVGNPPFIGNWRMRTALGDGYTEALRATIDDVPETADFVMYWWDHAAKLVRAGRLQRFGLITTNSLRQTFGRRVLEKHMRAKTPLSLLFAIPDHPWVDAAEGADVRIAMTVAAAGQVEGRLHEVVSESKRSGGFREVSFTSRAGIIHPNLRVGPDLTRTNKLKANDGLSCPGVKLHGAGFIVDPDEAERLGLHGEAGRRGLIRPYRNGRDITQAPRDVYVIDLYGLGLEVLRTRFPALYQHVAEHVQPHRQAAAGRTADSNQYAENWWLFGKARPELRRAIQELSRFIATPETAKHRFFVFLSGDTLPDNKLISIATEDPFHLGVLSSACHVAWALATGSRLGVGNDPVYVKSRCFDPFPFPDPADAGLRQRIRDLGEQLDAHRKRQQAAHPGLTMTGMYNVLEKLRSGATLTAKDKEIYEQGLVGVLKDIHDELDAAVFDAYGWPHDLSDEQILERLVALNRERAAEEARGHVRWLRPDFQAPEEARRKPKQAAFEVAADAAAPAAGKAAWPKELAQQVAALRRTLEREPAPVGAKQLARQFRNAREARVREILQSLVVLGHAREVEDDRYAA